MIKNLKALRKESGISQRQLGESIGVSQQSINKYENYEIEPDIQTLIAIAQFFHTSVDYLVGNSEIRRIIEKTTPFELNDEEASFIENYRQLCDSERKSLHLVADNYIALRKKT
ncbi:MAG: helix-turn-helix domain-containing protein [Anaerovoracaceae bacterium]